MDGKQQMKAMTKLASDQFKPDQLAGFRVGDQVRLPNIAAALEVIDLQPPAVLILRAPSGHELRAGWRAVTKIRTRQQIEEGGRAP
jgi:hypothetical protein